MKTTVACDELWPPLPGSWEEAVETYDEQRKRQTMAHTSSEREGLPHPAILIHPASQHYPASV